MTGYTVTIDRYDEQIVEGKRLGRHRSWDSRSAAYPYRASRDSGIVPIVSVLHPRHAPILDQGNLGSCTGNAATGALATTPLYEALPIGYPALDEKEAVTLYEAATRLDPYPGAWPPVDSGSDGLSACKAATQAGFLAGYTHAADLPSTLDALATGPVLLGLDWYTSFDHPGPGAVIAITPGATIRGGHEVVVRGIDADAKLILCDNSWGPSWGLAGSFSMGWETLHQLLANGGDVIVPVAANAPPPVPVPVPADRDHIFANDPQMLAWARRRPLSYPKRVFTMWAGGVQ